MNWMICFIDCGGSEILDYRKYVKDKTREEVVEIAKQTEKELYEKDDMVDWYEIHEDIILESKDANI